MIGEGMPMYKNPMEKGRLIIQFIVNFPEDNFLTNDKMNLLKVSEKARHKLRMCAVNEYILLNYSSVHINRCLFTVGTVRKVLDDEHISVVLIAALCLKKLIKANEK